MLEEASRIGFPLSLGRAYGDFVKKEQVGGRS